MDLGAGAGQFALAAARRFGHVTAVDVSPAMLTVLRERSAAAGLANLDCVRAGFLSYQHPGPPADGVYTRNALHQLPDFWKALALDRIAQMLRPGGVLRLRDLIYDFRPADAERIFQDWFDNAAADPADGYTSEDYAEHIRTEFSTFRWLLEPMLAAAGFEILTVEFEGRLRRLHMPQEVRPQRWSIGVAIGDSNKYSIYSRSPISLPAVSSYPCRRVRDTGHGLQGRVFLAAAYQLPRLAGQPSGLHVTYT